MRQSLRAPPPSTSTSRSTAVPVALAARSVAEVVAEAVSWEAAGQVEPRRRSRVVVTMLHSLRVSHRGTVLIDTQISQLHARTIALIAWTGGEHVRQFPIHAPVVIARLILTIEASLQEAPSAHRVWCSLVESSGDDSIDVDVRGVSGRPGSAGHQGGGGGGSAAWPSGGGGGGGAGAGLERGGPGGDGADGAIVIFQVAADEGLLDVDAIVTPGSGTWHRRADTRYLKVIAFGAGGGGAAGNCPDGAN